jgi:hypothetical protein
VRSVGATLRPGGAGALSCWLGRFTGDTAQFFGARTMRKQVTLTAEPLHQLSDRDRRPLSARCDYPGGCVIDNSGRWKKET